MTYVIFYVYQPASAMEDVRSGILRGHFRSLPALQARARFSQPPVPVACNLLMVRYRARPTCR
jgi:hypothetical protein